MPWNVNNSHKMTTPINTNIGGDIQQALNTKYNGDIGETYKRAAENNRINKWAKYRPVFGVNTPDTLTLAQRKAANWGFGENGIPVYSRYADLVAALRTGVTAGSHWTSPSASPMYRLLDLDGYVDNQLVLDDWGVLGVETPTALRFPFAGKLWVSSDMPGPYDTITRAKIEGEDPELHPSGLLYPNDFASMPSPLESFDSWYFGVLCVKATIGANESPDLWIVTMANPISSYDPEDVLLEGISFAKPNVAEAIGSGAHNLFPVLTSASHGITNFVNCAGSSWGGKVALIDGYRLPITLTASIRTFAMSFSVVGTNVSVSIHNNTSVACTITTNSLFAYIMANGLSSAEEDDVMEAADEWVEDGTKYTSGVTRNNILVGRYIDMFSAFLTANNNSNVIAAQATVSFTVPIGASVDGHDHSYGSDSDLTVCVEVTPSGQTTSRNYYDLVSQNT